MTTNFESTPALHYVALAYLAKHEANRLDHDKSILVGQCIEHLVSKMNVSVRAAEVATLQALGEHDSRECAAYVDMGLTTSYAIFIRDVKTARLRVFTVAELIALVKTPALSSVPVPSTREMLRNGVSETAPTH